MSDDSAHNTTATSLSFDNVLVYDTTEVITILPQNMEETKTERNLTTMNIICLLFLTSFVFLWFIWARGLFTSHLSGNKASHYEHIIGIWPVLPEGELMIVYEDRNELKFHTTPSKAESDCDEWKLMPQPISIPLPHPIIHALKITNTSVLFMHVSYASIYDLKTQKMTNQYPYPPQLYSRMNDDIVCVTANTLQNALYVVTSDTLFSFSVSSAKWSEHKHNNIIRRIASACAMDDSYSFIYIFGGETASKYVDTIIKYELMNGAWNVLSNVSLSHQTDRMQCELILSQIYCVVRHALYVFDPFQDRIINVHVSPHIQYHGIYPYTKSEIIMIGTNSTQT
eukprot:287405_1